MRIQLPEAFLSRMKAQLRDSYDAFLRSMEDDPVRGLRLNPLRPSGALQVAAYSSLEPIPWEKNGHYIPAASEAGTTIWHEAGAFYIQDPSAMIPARVLNAQPGERVLDLCAAPGGKSTQIGADLNGQGLLVANEPVLKRALILSRNIERMGIRNAIVINAMPSDLSVRWSDAFDAVLVDAPCSGEGMFRREPMTRLEWSEAEAHGCADRQRSILREAARMVRPGGRLVYSTCTYHPEENELNVEWFLQQFPEYSLSPFRLEGIDGCNGYFTCYPHRTRGEGQFIALLKREGDMQISSDRSETRSLQVPSTEEKRIMKEQFPSLPEATHRLGKTLIHLSALPDLSGIRVLRAGLHLGEIRGKFFVPDHAVCQEAATEMGAADVSAEDAIRYMAGEEMEGRAVGWTPIRCENLVIGWGKGSNGVIKNHYPKGLRNNRLRKDDPGIC